MKKTGKNHEEGGGKETLSSGLFFFIMTCEAPFFFPQEAVMTRT